MSDSKPPRRNRQDAPLGEDAAVRKYGPAGLHALMAAQGGGEVSKGQVAEIFRQAGRKQMSLAELAAYLTEQMSRRTK